MNLLNLFDILDSVPTKQDAETPAGIPAAVQVSQSDGQPATIVVPVATSDEVEVLEDAHDLDIGDEVIITGNVQYKGKTGRIVDFGKNKHFVVVDLYNFGKHSFHSSNVEANDYADSEQEESDWQERELGEAAQFGSIYAEELAQKVFDQNPDLPTTGRADELFKAGIAIAIKDLGGKRAQWEFNYDEDFFGDFVSAYAWLQRGGNPDGELEEGWKQNLAALGTAAALGAGGMAAFGGNAGAAPAHSGPELANPQQVVQMIKAGKIASSDDLVAALSNVKNKNQVWLVLQNAAGMQGSSDADAVIQSIAGNQAVREDNKETTDVYRKVFKKNGKPVGEVGIDLDAAPGNGDWYVKHYASGTDYSGYDTRQDAIDELKYMVKMSPGLNEVSPELKQRYLDKAYPAHGDYNMARRQTTGKEQEHYARKEKNTKAGIKRAVGEQGVAEEYDPSYDPEYRGYQPPEQDPDAWKQERDLEEPSSPKTVTIRDADGKVVLTFPSTGGYYGDVRIAKEKGFDTEAGDYDIKWSKGVAEGNNWLDAPVSEDIARMRQLSGLK